MANNNNNNEMLGCPMSYDYLTYENQGHEVKAKSIETGNVLETTGSSPSTHETNTSLCARCKPRRIFLGILSFLVLAVLGCTIALLVLVLTDSPNEEHEQVHALRPAVDKNNPEYKLLVEIVTKHKLLHIPQVDKTIFQDKTVADVLDKAVQDFKPETIENEIHSYNGFYYFVNKYNKEYPTFDDLVNHYISYRNNTKLIDSHNIKDSKYKLEMNDTTDLEFNEFYPSDLSKENDLAFLKRVLEVIKRLKTVTPTDVDIPNNQLKNLLSNIVKTNLENNNEDNASLIDKNSTNIINDISGENFDAPIIAHIFTSPEIQFYKSGIYTCPNNSKSTEIVLIYGIGYDNSTNTYFWKAVNANHKNDRNTDFIKLEVFNGNSGCELLCVTR